MRSREAWVGKVFQVTFLEAKTDNLDRIPSLPVVY